MMVIPFRGPFRSDALPRWSQLSEPSSIRDYSQLPHISSLILRQTALGLSYSPGTKPNTTILYHIPPHTEDNTIHIHTPFSICSFPGQIPSSAHKSEPRSSAEPCHPCSGAIPLPPLPLPPPSQVCDSPPLPPPPPVPSSNDPSRPRGPTTSATSTPPTRPTSPRKQTQPGATMATPWRRCSRSSPATANPRLGVTIWRGS